MNRWLRDCPKALMIGIVEVIVFLPVGLLFQAFLLHSDSDVLWLALLPLLYPIGMGINRLISFRHAFMVVLMGIVAAFLYSYLLFGLSQTGAVSAVAGTICFSRGALMAVRGMDGRLLTRHYAIAIVIYFFVSAIAGRMEPFAPFNVPLIAFGIFTLVLTLFVANRGNVNDESLSGKAKPMVEPTVTRLNRVLVFVIAAIAVLIVLTYQVQAAIGALWASVRSWLAGLFGGGEPQDIPPAEASPPPMQPPQLPPGESHTMPAWVNNLLYGIVAAIILVALWFALRALKRQFPEWFQALRKLVARLLGREKAVQATGYVDEVKSINKPGRLGGLWRFGSKEGRVRWKDLHDNEAKLRYLYRRKIGSAVKEGYRFKPHLTPSETEAELAGSPGRSEPGSELVSRYNDIRYGGKKLTDDQLRLLLEKNGNGGR